MLQKCDQYLFRALTYDHHLQDRKAQFISYRLNSTKLNYC